MRKLFLLIPLLTFALMAKADVTSIDNSTPDALRLALHYANDGDIIEMAGGVYEESNSNYIAFNAKSVTVRAAAGENVIIKPHVPFTVSGGARAEIQNVKIDASELCTLSSYSHLFYASDATANNRLILNGCEIYGYALNNSMIYCATDCALDALTFNNCYFHNIHKSCVFIANTTNPIDVTITNSTFAKITTESGYSAGILDVRATSGSLLVDHCTFYDVEAMNTDYAAIGKVGMASGAVVSNCIFALSASGASTNRTIRDKVAANNCLVFNYTTDSGYGMQSNVTKTNCFIADPLFNDLANNKYTYAGNWVTMNISPARGAATDGSDLGDPRWYSDEVLPESNFITPYTFVGEKAVISGNIWYDDTNDNLYYNDKSDCGTAKWKIRATRAGVVKATLNMTDGSSSGHIFRVEILDANGNQVDEVAEPAQSSHDGNIDLPNTLSIPAAGAYTIILHNDKSWSSAKIDGITLAYVGGAVVAVPAEELVGTEAVLVDNGHKKVYKLANGDLQYDDNGTPLGEYVYWNINATKRGNMKVTLNVVAPTEGSASTHDFLVELYSDLSGSPIASSAEAAATSGTGAKVLPDAINIPATGSYIIKLTNRTQYSSAILHSIEFEYLGGATITVPAEALIGEEAVLVDGGHLKVSKLANGDLKYGDNGYPLEEYVYWNINATKYGRMNVTANVVFDTEKDAEHQSSHQFLVELYSDLSGSPIASSAEDEATSATGAITMPAFNIPATGNYIIKLTNQKQWSSAILHSIEFAYAGGEVADVPGQIVGVDAMLLKEEGGTLKMYINDDGDIQYGNNGYNLTEYAVWNINATEAGEMIVTLNITNTGHLFTVELYDGATLKSSVAEPDANEWRGGNIELEDHLTIPAAGSYTIKLINREQYSGGAIHGITFTKYVPATAVTMSDEDAGPDAWSTYVDGDAVNVTVNRTILGGMLNAICLPFALNGSQVKAAFGNDVQWYYLNEASLENEVLDLQFAAADDIYQGTPYLIKTSSDVVNPTFNGVSIVLDEASSTYHTGWPISFQGTFVQTTIAADGQNMLIYANNQVGFPDSDKLLKGFRAYFRLSSASLAPSIKTARIITPNNTPTVIDLVNGQQSSAQSQKLLIDGRLIIVRDGVQYNVIGARVK